MINEYLFLSNEHKKEVEALEFDGVTFEFNDIKNTDLWTVRCSAEGKNEEGAKKLSDVHSNVIQFSPKVLTCESAQYFNNTLYPLVNEFERKLRKLVYLADAISGNEKNNIGELEEKDFGQIFDMLFIDEDFIIKLKSRVNATKGSGYEGKSRYAKSEILEFLNETDEKPLWNIIFDTNDVPTLKKRFRDIQTYRNDVMHAHNIDKKQYGKIKYLFDKVNSEMDIALGRRMNNSQKEHTTPEINSAISSALQGFTGVSESIYSNFAGIESIPANLDGLINSPACIAALNTINSVRQYPAFSELERVMSSPGYIDAINTMNSIAQNPDLMALDRIMRSPAFVEHLEKMEKIYSGYQQPQFSKEEERLHKLDMLNQQAIRLETMEKRQIDSGKKEDTLAEEDTSDETSAENDVKNNKK